jgi:hypothetical protein
MRIRGVVSEHRGEDAVVSGEFGTTVVVHGGRPKLQIGEELEFDLDLRGGKAGLRLAPVAAWIALLFAFIGLLLWTCAGR